MHAVIQDHGRIDFEHSSSKGNPLEARKGFQGVPFVSVINLNLVQGAAVSHPNSQSKTCKFSFWDMYHFTLEGGPSKEAKIKSFAKRKLVFFCQP